MRDLREHPANWRYPMPLEDCPSRGTVGHLWWRRQLTHLFELVSVGHERCVHCGKDHWYCVG